MVMMFWTNTFSSNNVLINDTAPIAITIEMMARAIGMNTAASAPKTIARMMSASGMANDSPRSRSAWLPSAKSTEKVASPEMNNS